MRLYQIVYVNYTEGYAILQWVCRDDQLASELAWCTVSFDADVSALRDAIQHFGRVTTSQSLQVDVPYTHHNRTDDQVSLLVIN